MAIPLDSTRRQRTRRAEPSDGDLREIAAMLRRRGFEFVEGNSTDRLVLPADHSPEEADRLYEELRRYSSRLLLRDLIKRGLQRGVRLGARFSRAESRERTLRRLADLRVAERSEGGDWVLSRHRDGGSLPGDRPVHSFGDTLEWFVAQIFRRELSAAAAWGVVVRGNAGGGDLDVVSLVENQFFLLEVKSSPPKHVDREVVRAFLSRVAALRPHAAFFVEDTELRMADKIVPYFDEALRDRRGGEGLPIRRIEHELYVVGEGIYIVNSRVDLMHNLITCVAHFLRGRGIGGLGER